MQRFHALIQRLTELEDVAAALEGDAQHQYGLPVVANGECGRVFKPAVHACHIGQAQQAAAGLDRHVGDILRVAQRAAHTQVDAVAAALAGARRGQGVLPCQRVDQRLRADAQCRELVAFEFDIDLLGLAAEDVPILLLYRQHAQWCQPERLPVAVCRDHDDDWVLATALAGGAEMIVTGDADPPTLPLSESRAV